jgi:hypothetical protein
LFKANQRAFAGEGPQKHEKRGMTEPPALAGGHKDGTIRRGQVNMPKKRSNKRKLIVAMAMLPFLFLALHAFGQSSSSLSGTVQDISKAVLPGASVTATNIETGVATTKITNNAGVYSFPSLQPGVYEVVAEMPGFQTITKTDVKLSLGGTQKLNFELPVEGVATEVEVVSSAQDLLLESGSSTGTVLQQESVTELPLVSNDVMDLINIMGGVVKAENPIFANYEQTFAGVAAQNVNIQTDGVTVNEIRYNSGIISPIRLNPEMIGEFKMILSPVDAEMGRGAGQVQVLTRSGGNEYHGSGVWNVQNTALDANEFFRNRVVPRQEADWRNLNNYTISASGPIIKNKTFFFAVWDHQIVRTKQSIDSHVLTPCARKGIFRYLDGWINANRDYGDPVLTAGSTRRVSVNADGSPIYENPEGYEGPATSELRYYSVLGELTDAAKAQIEQDPLNCSAYEFSGDYGIIPGTNWDEYRTTYDQSGFIDRFSGMMPPANSYEVGDGLNVGGHRWTRVLHGSDTVFGSGEDNERKSITIKIDHNLTSAHRVGGTYVYETDYGEDAYATWPEEYGGYGGAVDRQPQRFTVNLTSTIRPTLLNEFRVGLSRTRTHTNEPLNNPKTGDKMREIIDYLMPTDNFPNYSGYPLIVGAGSGIAGFQTDTFFRGMPTTSHPYGSRGNLPGTWGGVDPRWTFADNITWIKGNHTFKGGFEARLNKSWQETNSQSGFYLSANTFPSVEGGILGTSPPAPNELIAWEGMVGTDNGTSSSGNYSNAYALMSYIAGSVGAIRQYFYMVDPDNPRWNSATQGELNRVAEMHSREFSFFFKDQWKVTSDFDINLGLRYEYFGVPWVAGGMTAYIANGVDGLFGISEPGFENWMPENPVERGDPFDLDNEYLTRQILVGPDSPNPNLSAYNKDFNNFGPAVGFAWQLPWFGRGKTTLRGGYQLTYSHMHQMDNVSGYINTVPGTTYPFSYSGDTVNYPYMDMTMLPDLVPLDQFIDPDIQPLSVRPVTDRSAGISIYDPDVRSPYIQSLTLSLTRTIGSSLTVDVRYIGTLSRKQLATLNLNTSNAINNNLLEELKIVRAGGESELLNSMISPAGLCLMPWGSFSIPICDMSSASAALRGSYYTNTNLANGNLIGVVNTLATTNGFISAPAGTRGALLRATGTPENFIYANPQFSSANLTGNFNVSNYHSMQAQVTLRPTRGLSFQATYTWSRNLGDRGWTDYRDRAEDYGILSSNRSHQLTTYGTFELPFGANGFFFRSASGAVKKIIEGWQLSWTGSVTSGMPMSITGTTTLWGGGQPDLVGPFDPKEGHVTWEPGAWEGRFFGDKYMRVEDPQCNNIAPELQSICRGTSGLKALALVAGYDDAGNPIAGDIVFQNAEPGVRGNYSLSELSGIGRWSLDLAMSKSIEFMEGKRIHFRVDAQNILNHPTPSGGSPWPWNARFTQVYNPSDMGLNTTQDFARVASKGGHRTFQAKIRITF